MADDASLAALAGLRRIFDAKGTRSTRVNRVDDWLARGRAWPALLSKASLPQQFSAAAEAAGASVTHAAGISDLLALLRRLMKAAPAAMVAEDAPWRTHMLAYDQHRPEIRTPASLVIEQVPCGVAETGSLVVRSGGGLPWTTRLLCETHLAVLHEADIVARPEDAWTVMTKRETPATVGFITGPSRSADIEQTMTLGAHGPRALHIVLVAQG